MEGRTLSVTVTVCVQVAVFPLASVAVQIASVLPIGKAEGALFVTDTPAQLSLATGVPKSTPVAVQPLLVVACTFAGQAIVGVVVSVTVTVCAQAITLPPAIRRGPCYGGRSKWEGGRSVVRQRGHLAVVRGYGLPRSTLVAAQPLLAAT